MRWLAFLLLAVAAVCSAEAQTQEQLVGECREPESVKIPDGAKVEAQKMLSVQSTVEAYISDTQAFLDCLLEAEKAQGETLTFEQEKQSITRYNLAIARMEGLVESFNQQLHAYKRANVD